jgi:hypothetical protein
MRSGPAAGDVPEGEGSRAIFSPPQPGPPASSEGVRVATVNLDESGEA